MTLNNTVANILKEIEEKLEESSFFINKLKTLDLQGFENDLYNLITDLYSSLVENIIQFYTNSDIYAQQAKAFSQQKDSGKLQKRETKLQIITGKKIKITNYYVRKISNFYKGPRHTFHAMFGTIANASPKYYSLLSMLSVISPSFEVATEILKILNIKTDVNRLRIISIKVGNKCLDNRVGIQLKPGETLAGKNVVVSIDGGRSRIREKKEELNSKGTHHLFDTNWREPKLFVIHIIDPKTGRQSKSDIPLYDCTFGTEDSFKLLSEYLEKLEINRANRVQFIADGATWIWDRAKDMLLDLGVKSDNIIETLDFYHGTEHLSEIVKNIPKRISSDERKALYLKLKKLLWNGKITELKQTVNSVIKRTNKAIRRELKYFNKHINRCNYATYRNEKLLCGSGIIESGIRRIINLRFKCPSSFWCKDNLESLVFLRATLLAKRWEFMILNLSKL